MAELKEKEKQIKKNEKIEINSSVETKVVETEKIDTCISEINEQKQTKTTYKKSKIVAIVFASLFIILLLLVLAFTTFTYVSTNNDKIIKGVTIEGISMDNLTKEEAKQKVTNEYLKLPETINLVYKDFSTSILVSSLEIQSDIDYAVDSAYLVARDNSFFSNGFNHLKALFNKQDTNNININIKFNEDILKTSLDDISGKLPDIVTQSSYYIKNNSLIISSGTNGSKVDTETMFNLLKEKICDTTITDESIEIQTLVITPDPIDINAIYSQVHSKPVNAVFKANPYTFTPGKNGVDFAITLDKAKKMLEESKAEYIIPLKILYPASTNNSIGMEAFPNLLSSYVTTYDTAKVDRTTNLYIAARNINGKVLMPGEVFSYNRVVGRRTVAAGFKNAGMYVNGEEVDGLGGGICQVASTLYNTALLSNLEIVARSNHMFDPQYTPLSRDATVVYGAIDFQFKNSRNYPIKILCSVKNGKCSFSIHGIKEANEPQVSISSYQTGSSSTAVYSEAYRILTQNGQVISRTLLSKDTYKNH